MLSSRTLKQVVGSISLIALVFATMPVSAAELTPTKALGSVSIAGPVQLRGIPVSREGTIFTGDQLSVGTKGYAKVMLVQGHKLELDQLTDLTVSEQGPAVQLLLKSGNLGFTTAATGSVQIVAGNYEITSDKPMSGNVAVIGSGYIGVHLLNGTATMRNVFTRQTVRIPGGEERMVSFAQDPSRAPIAQLASNDPVPLPAPMPTMPPVPAPQQSAGNRGLSKVGWIAVIGTVAGAATAIAILATRSTSTEPGNTSAQAAVLANDNAAMAGANQGAANSTAASNAATSAAAAINASSASNKATLAAQAQSIASQSQANSQQFASLQATLTSLQAQLQATTDNGSLQTLNGQIASATATLNAIIAAQNTLVQQFDALLAQASSEGILGLPSTTSFSLTSTVTLPNASNSIP